MTQFTSGQKLTAKDLNEAFDSVAGPINPSKDYQWTQTNVGKIQKGWDTFIQVQNQNPDTLEIGIGYSEVGSERVVEIGGKKPAALRRVFINLGPLRSIMFPGKNFINIPNIGDINGIPLLGIIGLEWHNSSDVYFPGDGRLHFSLWNPLANWGSTPSEWSNRQRLYTDDVYRGADSRYWWWSGITLDRHQPEGEIGNAEGLDIVCFPMFVYWAKQQGSSTPEIRFPLLCVMLKQDYEGLRAAGNDLTGLSDALESSYGYMYPDYNIVGIGWGNRPDQWRILGRYGFSSKSQNAYYSTNLNYLHFDNDTSSCHFTSFSPVNSMYNVNRQVIYPFQWIDDSGKHHCENDTRRLNVVQMDGTPIEPFDTITHTALACGWNKNTMSSPVLSCVSFLREDMMATSDPAQAILSGLFNDPSYGLSSETQKRLIWINNMDAMGVQYYDTCPDFRTGETPDSDISSSCLSSIQDKDIELEVDEGQEAQSMKLWSLWGFDDFENAKDWPAQSEISGWDLVARHIHEVDGKNVGEIQYISLSALSGGDGAPGDADTTTAGLSSIQTRTLTGGEKVLQLYKFDDEEYVEDDIGDNLSAYDMVLRNREGNCVAYGSLSAIGGEVDLSGTDGTHKKGSAFKFKSADDSNIIVTIDNNGIITMGCYYL